MADWWQADPVLGGNASDKNWWDGDPILGGSKKAEAPKPVDKPEAELGPFGAGWKGMGSDLRTAAAAGASALGYDETAKGLLDEANKSREEVGRRYKPKVPSFTDIKGIGDLGQYVYEQGAQSLPQMGATALGAGAAALAAPAAPVLAGIAGGTAAALPFFTGQNIKEQLDEGRSLRDTSLPTAVAAGVAQGALDTLVGKVLPGVGKAAAGGAVIRAVKKGVEGGFIEGLTESAQQAIQIGQANPGKLFSFSPEVQKELAEAAVAGGLLGGGLGAASGVAQRRKMAQVTPPVSSPQVDENPIPPPTAYSPNGTGLPVPNEPLGLPSGTGLPEPGAAFQTPSQPLGYTANKTGLPEPNEPVGLPSGTGLPEINTPAFNPVPNPAAMQAPTMVPNKTGLPIHNEAIGLDSQTGLPEPGVPTKPLPVDIKASGQRVYKDIQQKLLAAGASPMYANANAALYRARYETLGRQLNVAPYEAYRQSGVDIQKGDDGKPTVAQKTQEQTLNQEELPGIAKHYSALQSAIERVPMKQGTGQQWLNTLKKNGVKDEELEWTGMWDYLENHKNKTLPKEEVGYAFRPYDIAVYEAKPHEQGFPNTTTGNGLLSHYGEYTLGAHGVNPESNYREVVLSDATQPSDTYKSGHFAKVPNPIAHYRTTDRVTDSGSPVLMAEEIQSDWHQKGRERGYQDPKAMDRIAQEADAVFYAARAELQKMGLLARSVGEIQEHLDMANPNGFQPENKPKYSESFVKLAERSDKLRNDYLDVQSAPPNAPFKDNWPNMAFRHALMDAINQGKEYIAWPTGEQQASLYWSDPNPEKLNGMQAFYDKRLVDYANKLGKPFGSKVETITVVPKDTTGLDARRAKLTRDLYLADSDDAARRILHELKSMAHHDVHAMKITPPMRELLQKGGLPLFQKTGKNVRGNITIAPDKAIIRLFKSFNASTFPHESMHLWLEEMRRYAPENVQIAQDLKTILDFVGKDHPDKITTADHEKVARAFEQYLRSGKAPSLALADVFKQFAQWLKKIYTRAEDLNVKLTPEMHKVFDRLLAQDESLNSTSLREEPGANALRPVQGAERTYNQEDPETQKSPVANESSIYSALNQAARKTKAFFDPFSEVPQESHYRDLRNLMGGGVYAAQQSATKAKKLFDKLDTPTKDKVNSYLETQGASPHEVPPDIRTETVALKQYINGPLRKSLIDNNLLPATAEHTHDDSYLPRLYLKHLVEAEGVKGSGAKLNKAYSKKRTEKTPEQLIAMGEVKDPGVRAFHALFRTQRDLAVKDFLDKVAANESWAMPESLVPWNGKKVTPFWLKNEADHIEEHRMPAEADFDRRTAMKAEADRMRAAATEGIKALNSVDFDAKEYKKLPDTADFGPLRGMIVKRQIADDIIGTNNFVDPDNTIDKWFGDRNSKLTRATSVWKALKVPLNPPSQMRNVASNMILLNLSGVPIHQVVPRMVQAARDMRSNGKYYQIAKQYGVTQGTFTEQELFGLSDELKKLDAANKTGFAGWRTIYRAIAKVGVKAGDIHQKMEEWGKVAKIIDSVEREGMAPNDAVREANKWLFDYSEAVPSVKRIRQMPLGMPFITFQYKMAPLLTEIIKSNPTRLLPYIALAYTVPALVAASNDIDEDDADKLKKALSENLRRKQDMYLLPWKDDAGRWQFVDIGYFMPWQMPVSVGRSLGEGAYHAAIGKGREATKDFGDAFQSSSLLSNPVLNISAALTTGIDPFTSKPIADKRDPMQKQVADIVGYAWSLAMPSMLAGYGAAGQLLNKEQGTGMNRYGEPTNTYGQIAARTMGVNTYPVVPEAQRARNIQFMQREIQDIKGRMTSSLKDQSLTPADRRRIVENFKDELLDRTKSLSDYVKESQMSPKLREATNRP